MQKKIQTVAIVHAFLKVNFGLKYLDDLLISMNK